MRPSLVWLVFQWVTMMDSTVMGDPLYPRLPLSVTAEIEGKDFVQNTVKIMREYIDYERDLQRIDVTLNGTHLTYLKDYNTATNYYYTNGSCQLLGIDQSDTDSHGHITSLMSIFELGVPGNNYTYLGTDTVRGIPADVWKLWGGSKSYQPGTITNFTIRYYFLKEDTSWTNPMAPQNTSTPLRLWEEGVTYNVADGSLVRNINNQYDLTYWLPGTPHEYHFLRGSLAERYKAVCPTWEKPAIHKALPLLPDSFSSRIEANIINKKYSLERRDLYDATTNRIGHITHTSDGGLRSVITTFDPDNQEYDETIHKVAADGTCITTTETRPASSFFSVFNQSTGGLQHTAAIFGESGNYSFEGNASVRGIVCEQWTKKETFERKAFRPANITFILSYYFTEDPPWSFYSLRRRDLAANVNRVSVSPNEFVKRSGWGTGLRFNISFPSSFGIPLGHHRDTLTCMLSLHIPFEQS